MTTIDVREGRYIYAQDKLDEAQIAVDKALIAVRTLGYEPVVIVDASENLKRWRRRLAADRADTLAEV